jgi:hypothetical protein
LAFAGKETLPASEQLRPDLAERRKARIEKRQPAFADMLDRLVLIDDTSLRTNPFKTAGRALVGQRLIDRAPFGHWNTQSGALPVRRRNLSTRQISGRASPVIAGLGHDGLIAPWVLDGAMYRASFGTCVEKQLVPALTPGQVVVADNQSLHKSPRVVERLTAKGCEFLFLPPHSPTPSVAFMPL